MTDHLLAGPHSMPAVLAAAAQRWPGGLAVVDGARRVTFADLEHAVDRAAGAFVAAGLQVGDRVAIWAENRTEWIVAWLGAQAAGGVLVTLNTRLKPAEAQYILNRSRARILVTTGNFLRVSYPEALAGLDLPHLDCTIAFDREWDDFTASGSVPDIERGRARRSALSWEGASDILFTSGTTGLPKGVVAGQGQTLRTYRAWADRVGLDAGDRYLIINPFFHSFGCKAGWLACLMVGATAYPVKTFDVEQALSLIQSERITAMPGPPSIFQSLLAVDRSGRDISSLRLAITGAASVAPSLIRRMRDELGIDVVLSGYGLTETCGVVTIGEAGDSPERIALTVGKPLPGTEVQCFTASGAPVATGQEGEVRVRGYNVMPGYFEDSDATAQAIDADGWLRTGDVGKFDADGYLQITDRLKDMYISGGFNCYPAEVERVLLDHPSVAMAAVIGVPDERLGDVGAAFVTLRPGATLDGDALVAWARERIANYKAPRYAAVLPDLPLNASGKVEKYALRRRVGELLPGSLA